MKNKFIIPKPITFKSKTGRECYLSGIFNDEGTWKASVRYIDTGEIVEVNYNIIEKYL